MPNDYISREAVLNRIEELQKAFGRGETAHEEGFFMGLNRMLAEVDNFPAADVVQGGEAGSAAKTAERKRGEWMPSNRYKGYVSCSNCHECYVDPEWIEKLKWHFCPHCGAEMRGKADDI